MRKPKLPIKSILTALAIIFLVLVIIENGNSIKTTVKNTKIIPQKESFTELYFLDHDNLSTPLISDNPKNFTFTIHNLENQNMTYPYVVYLKTDGKRQTLAKGEVTVADGGFKNINESFSANNINKNTLVVVTLLNKNQDIDFWVNKE